MMVQNPKCAYGTYCLLISILNGVYILVEISFYIMNIKTKSNIIYVDVNFRHKIHSAEFVSGRLLRFNISKFYQIMFSCWCILPDYLLNAFTSHTHRFIKIKGVSIIAECATIKQRSQPLLWSDSMHVSKLQQTAFNHSFSTKSLTINMLPTR